MKKLKNNKMINKSNYNKTPFFKNLLILKIIADYQI